MMRSSRFKSLWLGRLLILLILLSSQINWNFFTVSPEQEINLLIPQQIEINNFHNISEIKFPQSGANSSIHINTSLSLSKFPYAQVWDSIFGGLTPIERMDYSTFYDFEIPLRAAIYNNQSNQGLTGEMGLYFWDQSSVHNPNPLDVYYNTTIREEISTIITSRLDLASTTLDLQRFSSVVLSEEECMNAYKFSEVIPQIIQYNESFHDETGFWLRDGAWDSVEAEHAFNEWFNERNTWCFNWTYDVVKSYLQTHDLAHILVYQFLYMIPWSWAYAEPYEVKADGFWIDPFNDDPNLVYHNVRMFKTIMPDKPIICILMGDAGDNRQRIRWDSVWTTTWAAWMAGADQIAYFSNQLTSINPDLDRPHVEEYRFVDEWASGQILRFPKLDIYPHYLYVGGMNHNLRYLFTAYDTCTYRYFAKYGYTLSLSKYDLLVLEEPCTLFRYDTRVISLVNSFISTGKSIIFLSPASDYDQITNQIRTTFYPYEGDTHYSGTPGSINEANGDRYILNGSSAENVLGFALNYTYLPSTVQSDRSVIINTNETMTGISYYPFQWGRLLGNGTYLSQPGGSSQKHLLVVHHENDTAGWELYVGHYSRSPPGDYINLWKNVSRAFITHTVGLECDITTEQEEPLLTATASLHSPTSSESNGRALYAVLNNASIAYENLQYALNLSSYGFFPGNPIYLYQISSIDTPYYTYTTHYLSSNSILSINFSIDPLSIGIFLISNETLQSLTSTYLSAYDPVLTIGETSQIGVEITSNLEISPPFTVYISAQLSPRNVGGESPYIEGGIELNCTQWSSILASTQSFSCFFSVTANSTIQCTGWQGWIELHVNTSNYRGIPTELSLNNSFIYSIRFPLTVYPHTVEILPDRSLLQMLPNQSNMINSFLATKGSLQPIDNILWGYDINYKWGNPGYFTTFSNVSVGAISAIETFDFNPSIKPTMNENATLYMHTYGNSSDFSVGEVHIPIRIRPWSVTLSFSHPLDIIRLSPNSIIPGRIEGMLQFWGDASISASIVELTLHTPSTIQFIGEESQKQLSWQNLTPNESCAFSWQIKALLTPYRAVIPLEIRVNNTDTGIFYFIYVESAMEYPEWGNAPHITPETNLIITQNTPDVFLNWSISDDFNQTGIYNITCNGELLVGFGPNAIWANNSAIDVPVNTSIVGEFTYQINASDGVYLAFQNIKVIIDPPPEDNPRLHMAESQNRIVSINAPDEILKWYLVDRNNLSGNYNITCNGILFTSTAEVWENNSFIEYMVILSSIGFFQYNITVSDGMDGHLTSSIVNLTILAGYAPTINFLANVQINFQQPYSLHWIIEDQDSIRGIFNITLNGDLYRNFGPNSHYYVHQTLSIPVNSSVAGTFIYSISFCDGASGNLRFSTVTVIVNESPIPRLSSPPDFTCFEHDSEIFLTWIPNDADSSILWYNLTVDGVLVGLSNSPVAPGIMIRFLINTDVIDDETREYSVFLKDEQGNIAIDTVFVTIYWVDDPPQFLLSPEDAFRTLSEVQSHGYYISYIVDDPDLFYWQSGYYWLYYDELLLFNETCPDEGFLEFNLNIFANFSSQSGNHKIEFRYTDGLPGIHMMSHVHRLMINEPPSFISDRWNTSLWKVHQNTNMEISWQITDLDNITGYYTLYIDDIILPAFTHISWNNMTLEAFQFNHSILGIHSFTIVISDEINVPVIHILHIHVTSPPQLVSLVPSENLKLRRYSSAIEISWRIWDKDSPVGFLNLTCNTSELLINQIWNNDSIISHNLDTTLNGVFYFTLTVVDEDGLVNSSICIEINESPQIQVNYSSSTYDWYPNWSFSYIISDSDDFSGIFNVLIDGELFFSNTWNTKSSSSIIVPISDNLAWGSHLFEIQINDGFLWENFTYSVQFLAKPSIYWLDPLESPQIIDIVQGSNASIQFKIIDPDTIQGTLTIRVNNSIWDNHSNLEINAGENYTMIFHDFPEGTYEIEIEYTFGHYTTITTFILHVLMTDIPTEPESNFPTAMVIFLSTVVVSVGLMVSALWIFRKKIPYHQIIEKIWIPIRNRFH